MDFITAVLGYANVSLVVALVTGMSLGLYLASIHYFVPVRNLRRSLITDIVIGLSFFGPLAMMRVVTSEPTLGAEAWAAFTIVWFVFSITADLTNWALCQWYNATRN